MLHWAWDLSRNGFQRPCLSAFKIKAPCTVRALPSPWSCLLLLSLHFLISGRISRHFPQVTGAAASTSGSFISEAFKTCFLEQSLPHQHTCLSWMISPGSLPHWSSSWGFWRLCLWGWLWTSRFLVWIAQKSQNPQLLNFPWFQDINSTASFSVVVETTSSAQVSSDVPLVLWGQLSWFLTF